MDWHEQFQQLTDREQEQFRDIVNLLFSKTFLVYQRDSDRMAYRFVEKHLTIFQGYFNLAQWELYHARHWPVFQLYNKAERNRRRLTLQESLLLFILRLLYDDKEAEVRATEQVIVQGWEIQEKYLALQIRNRLPAQDDLQRTLRLFAGFSLLDLAQGSWTDAEAAFILYPSLLLVLEEYHLEHLMEWMQEQTGQQQANGELEGGEADAEFDADESH